MNVAPTDILLSESTISEDAELESVIGSLLAVDANENDTHTFVFVTGGADNVSFTIEGASLEFKYRIRFRNETFV